MEKIWKAHVEINKVHAKGKRIVTVEMSEVRVKK